MTFPTHEDDELGSIVDAIRDHLRYLRENGVNAFPIPREYHIPGIFTVNPVPSDDGSSLSNKEKLMVIRANIGDCTRCRLSQGRTSIVFGEGNPSPQLVFVGEGPGMQEDEQGIPFVGSAGQLLDRIISAMGLQRSDVYICNVVKCRPPNNRDPFPDEIQTCSPFLIEQLTVLHPKVICALGNVAASFLLDTHVPISKLRGRFYQFRDIKVRPTFHPAAILRNSSLRRPVWEDIKEIMQYLGKSINRV